MVDVFVCFVFVYEEDPLAAGGEGEVVDRQLHLRVAAGGGD